jgi:hypothetical protein
MIACQNEEPLLSQESETAKVNLTKRTSTEALQIAYDSYSELFDSREDSNARSEALEGRVSVIPSHRISRSSATENDTCLYVVNFNDNQGFAIIAADRSVEALLGISDQGNYSVDNTGENPGVDLFVEQALTYVDNTDPSENSDSVSAIWNGDDKLRVKEWLDTTYQLNIAQRIGNAWSLGCASKTIEDNPEGLLFRTNYRCGDAVVAIAQTCLYFNYPEKILPTTHPTNSTVQSTTTIYPDWSNIGRHRMYLMTKYVKSCTQAETEYHPQIASICRAIGNLGNVSELGDINNDPYTIMNMDYFSYVFSVLGYHMPVWETMDNNVLLSENNAINVMHGYESNTMYGVYWLVDGERCFTVTHHFATASTVGVWNDTIISTYTRDLIHINWGRGGDGNGWYTKGVYTPSDITDRTYISPIQYATISR